MKKIKIIVLALILFAMNVSATVIDPTTPTAKLRAEIIELIGTNCPFEFDKDFCTAEVIFTINHKNEIVILTVTSENPGADSFIKNKINYVKVHHKVKKEGTLFMLPLRIVKPS